MKEIKFFTLQIFYSPDLNFDNFSSIETKFFFNILLKITHISKVLYLGFNTIIRKTLLPLWEIDMNKKLVAGVEDLLLDKNEDKKINLNNNFFINDGVLLLNIREWKKIKLDYYIKVGYLQNKNQGHQTFHNFLNTIIDSKKIRLSNEFNFMAFMKINTYESHYNISKLYQEIDLTIIQISFKFNYSVFKSSLSNEILYYYNLLNNLTKSKLIIPIVLSTDNKYAAYLYTTMVSILENGYKNTFYSFYLLVPSNFSKTNENIILKLNNIYKCYISFIYIKKMFENLIQKIPHITFTYYYRLLIGDLLPKEINKCIYLDSDICVCKDLTELFNMNMSDNYLLFF